MYIRAENPFDYDNPAHVQALLDKMPSLNKSNFARSNNWKAIESPEVQKAIRAMGHDSFYVLEHGEKNIAVYSPTQVKSAIGNTGAYGQRPITKEEAARTGMTQEEAQKAQAKGDLRFSLREVHPDLKAVNVSPDMVEQWKKMQAYDREKRDILRYGEGPSLAGVKAHQTRLTRTFMDLAEQNGLNRDSSRDMGLAMQALGKRENNGGDYYVNPSDTVRYSKRTVVKDDLRAMPNGAAILATMSRVTPEREHKGFAERILGSFASEARGYFRQQALDRYDRLSTYDKMIAKKMGGVDLLADQSAHWAALHSDAAAGIAASALGVGDRMGGVPVLKNGYVTVSNLNNTVKGVVDIISPLAAHGDPDIYRLYQLWSAAKRGTRLYREGRFELLTPN
jgi:hypothetical protein